jgi:type VI protein secretion system component VasK
VDRAVTGLATGVLVLVVLVALVATLAVVAKSRAAGREPGRPDEVSEDVATRLMAELRKWQAEAAYWKATAERLQRELDQRR